MSCKWFWTGVRLPPSPPDKTDRRQLPPVCLRSGASVVGMAAPAGVAVGEAVGVGGTLVRLAARSLNWLALPPASYTEPVSPGFRRGAVQGFTRAARRRTRIKLTPEDGTGCDSDSGG